MKQKREAGNVKRETPRRSLALGRAAAPFIFQPSSFSLLFL